MKRILFSATALLLLLPTSLTQPQAVSADGKCGIEQSSPNVEIVVNLGLAHIYTFGLSAPCADDISVFGVYGTETKTATETLSRNIFGGGSIKSEFTCPADPWLEPTTKCTKLTQEVNGISPQDLAISLEMLAQPSGGTVSTFVITETARATLKSLFQAKTGALPAPAGGNTTGAPKPAGAVDAPTGGMSFSTGDPLENPSYGDNVMALQYLLKARGYGAIDLNGEFEDQTEGFVKDFQKKNQLPANGIVGPETWGKLWAPLKRGAQGDTVKAAQSLLVWHTLDIDINGVFGPETEDAVKVFQEDKGVPVTGEIDVRTWAALVNGN